MRRDAYAKTICLDFDGVIHGYQHGWCGAKNIPDPPVPGALEFIFRAASVFDVAIFSCRSQYDGGIKAMKEWTLHQYIDIGMSDEVPTWWKKHLDGWSPEFTWKQRVHAASKLLVSRVLWPKNKPAAHLTIDDRSVQFTGKFPSIKDVSEFKPWNGFGDMCRLFYVPCMDGRVVPKLQVICAEEIVSNRIPDEGR